MSTTINDLYSDLDPDLTIAWNKDISKSVGMTAVKNSILGIILTKKGTRPFLPDFGCGIDDSLFEIMTPLVADTVSKNITTAVQTYEPRVASISCEVTPVYDNNTIIVTVTFSVIDNPDTINQLKLTIEQSM